MVRGPLRFITTIIVSEAGYRVIYVASSSIYLLLVMFYWAPMPVAIWDIQHETTRTILHSKQYNKWWSCECVESIEGAT